VDFANKARHIHRIIASLTQEEVLFSIYPECFLGLMLCEVMKDDEAIIIRNAHRACNYSGYSETFQFVPRLEHATAGPDIIAIDAIVNHGSMQFKKKFIDRDLNKAFIGFASTKSTGGKIATGKWGCGVFAGDVALKYLQQVLAASACNRQLHFSSFSDAKALSELRYLHTQMQAANLKVKQLYNMLLELEAQNISSPLESKVLNFVMAQLQTVQK
jgi:poly(ADP-ribose) glycohydrolase